MVLDGALATELENRGCDLLDPLWSGKVLIDSPRMIEDVAMSYLEAGAQCLITASYQVTPESLMEHRGWPMDRAIAVVEESVKIAQRARDHYKAANPQSGPIFIAGSVGPYGAYLSDGSEYQGNYHYTRQHYKDFHRSRIASLLRAGADVLAIETQPCAEEVLAVLELLQEEHPSCEAWVSFTISRQNPVHAIADGTLWTDLLPQLEAAPQVIAVGVNCIPTSDGASVLRHLHSITTLPLVIYTNSNEVYDAVSKTWCAAVEPEGASCTLVSQAKTWVQCGARLIGGCCRTTPSDIADLSAVLRS